MKKNLFRPIRGCSNFLLNNSDNSIISARTMDYDIPIQAEIVMVPKGQNFTSFLSSKDKCMQWSSKYGFVGTNVLHSLEFTDGLNEKGLSLATLWLDDSEYPTPHNLPREKTITIVDLPSWILGNFTTIEEVINGMKDIFVIGKAGIENPKTILPLHIAIHDQNKKSLVIEFTKKKIQIYEENASVLTNYPLFLEQIKLLENYKNTIDSSKWLEKLPGDFSSTSRFILIHILNHFVQKASNDREAVMNALHILNRVTMVNGEIAGNSTQYQIIRDHKNLIYYVTDNNNMNLRALDMKKLDFSINKIMSFPIANDSWFTSVNNQLKPFVADHQNERK